MIKINLEHNLSSLKIPQLRVDPHSTILALKQNIQKRYGSEPNYLRLTLKSQKGDVVTQMQEDLRTLNFYGVENGMIVFITDLNPISIHKQIQNVGQIQKYTMSQETYNLLPQNFRKWKHSFLSQNPQIKNSLSGQPQICDPDYLKNLALTMQIGQRCQLENGARGEIKYIGKVIDIGYGWFIGIELDQPVPGFGDGTVEGMYYFMCDIGKGVFQRPNKVEVGQFPKIQENDQI